MPGIIGWATLRGSRHTNLLQLNLPNLTVKGSSPKFSKRTILTDLLLFLPEFQFSHRFSAKSGEMAGGRVRAATHH